MQLFITKGCIFSFVNLIVGLSVGPNAALASLIGQKKRDKIPEMLHTILAFGVLLGVGLMVLGLLLARVILEVSGTPESVMGEALPEDILALHGLWNRLYRNIKYCIYDLG